jgi:hypothetical protein
MKKVKVLKHSNLPAKLPVLATLVVWMFCDYTDANFVVRYILWSWILLGWAVSIFQVLRQEKVSLKELNSDKDGE